jgi:hypothetical protein
MEWSINCPEEGQIGQLAMEARTIKRATMDRSRVSTADALRLRYWCGRFVCTENELKDAVSRVGVAVAKVEEYLNKRTRPASAR